MTERVILELPTELAQQARSVAARTQRRLDEVLVEWIRHAGAEPVLELLPDDELLTVCDGQLPLEVDEELSELLEQNRDGTLTPSERTRLDELMRTYRAGMVRKAQALKVAVSRGLRLRLS